MGKLVLPLTREWIEIRLCGKKNNLMKVLPLTREWIEIRVGRTAVAAMILFSLLRGSGLK